MYMNNLRSRIPHIISVVILILGIIIAMQLLGINLDETSDSTHIAKIVTVEAYDNMHANFCETYRGKRHELEEKCNELTKKNCLATNCCVYANIDGSEKCMSGSKHGPTYRTNDDGTNKEVDYYYYKNKCVGKGCP
jgi:hypothetical protein